jgi:hypothetical protein
LEPGVALTVYENRLDRHATPEQDTFVRQLDTETAAEQGGVGFSFRQGRSK